MKRVISLLISIMLIFTMTITSSAATIASLVAGVGTDADRTVSVTVNYNSPEEAQESTLLIVKKGVSIVTATADQIHYIDQKVVDGNSVTYLLKLAEGDRIGQYDLYVGGTKIDAPASTVINFDTDATVTIKFVKEDGTEIASSAMVSGKLGDTITLSDYAPDTITSGTSIYKKDSTNPATYNITATTSTLTITYSYDSEVPVEAKEFVVNGITYTAISENLVANGTFESNTNGWISWDGSGALGQFSRSTAQAHSGDYSLKSDANGGGTTNGSLVGQFDLDSEVKAGDKYVLSFWSYSNNAAMTLTVGLGADKSSVNVDIDCGGLGNSGTDPISCNVEGLATNTWRQHMYVLNAKDTSTFAELYARWLGTGTYFDDVELYKVEQVYRSYSIGDEYVYDGVTYAVASDNLISNGSFENAEGNFDTTGWLSQETNAAIPNPQTAGDDHWSAGTIYNYYYMGASATLGSQYDRWGTKYTGPRRGNPTDGNWYLMSQWGDGFGGLCCIKRSFPLESGKKYVLMYDIKSNAGNKTAGTVYVGTTLAAGTGTAAGAITEDWKTVTTVVDGTASVTELWFNAYSLGNGICFDNFQMYELEVPQTVFDVTANYVANGQTVKTVTKSYDAAIADGATFEAYNYHPNGGNYIYESAATTLSEDGNIVMTPWTNNGTYTLNQVVMHNNVAYKVVSGNLVPNGDFSHGVTGWYNSAGGEAGSAFVANAADGTVTNANNGGAADANSLWRGWATEVGKTYLFTFDASVATGYFAVSEKDDLTATGDGTRIGEATVAGTNTIVYTATKPYVQINFRWIAGKTMGNFGLYEIEEDAASMANTTIKFVDSSNTSTEIATAVTVKGLVGSTIDLTDTTIVPEAITYNGNVYSKDNTNATSYTVVGNTDTVTLTYTTDAITEIDTVNVTVINGNAPILPTTLGAKTGTGSNTTVTVTSWDTSSLTVGTNTVYGTVDGLTMKAEATVTVLPVTFTLNDADSTNGQPGNVIYFPADIADEFTIEFDLTINQIKDVSVQMGYEGNLFGAAALGISPNGNLLKVTGGNKAGTGEGIELVNPVAAGETYRMLLVMDASDDTYTLTVTKADGTQVTTGEKGFRTAQDAINTMTLLTNGGGATGDIHVSNVKIYSASTVVETYTVNAMAGSTVLESFTEYAGESDKLGYNSEVIYPNVKIPSYDGYVFKNKTVSGNVVTLNYEEVTESEFFDNVANDTKFVSLNMLGAHDAFTASIASSGAKFDAAGAAQGDSGSKSAVSSASTAAPMSKAQSQDALTMLNYGVRYFDIRLSRSDTTAKGGLLGTTTVQHTNGVFYTTHGMLSDEFRPIAYTIAQWAKAHPGEIVVLDFQEMWDNTSTAGSTGDSVAQSWTDLNNLLKEAGIYDYVTINNGTDLSTVTYGNLTNNGEKAGIVLFGRAVATNASVGSFILRGTTSTAFDGKMYSNYSFGDASVSSSALANTYIQAQVDHAYTQTGTVNNMYRVMQAISSTSNLINKAGTDNTFITGAVKTNPTWLTTLPVVMVNDATVNTSELLEILKSCNVPIDVTMNYTIGGATADTGTAKLMVGTLYTNVVGALYAGTNGEYAVTEAVTGEIPVPYNGSLTITVEKLGNVYSTRIENGAHSVYSGNLDDAAVYSGKTNFAAYTWGQDNDRLGVAVLSAEKGKTNYALSANVVRSNFNQDYRNVKFYVLPVSEYRALGINDKNALLAALTEDNLVATINPDNYGVGTQTIVLDGAKIAAAAANGDVVIIGNAQGGLYGIAGEGMAIVTGYNVTVNENSTVSYGTYTLPTGDTAIAYYKEGSTNVYKPGATAPITSDTSFVPYYALGADMVDGAQVRIGDGVDEQGKVANGSGLRFITTIDRMDTLASLTNEGVTMEFGVEVTAEGSSAAPVVIEAKQWQVPDEVFTSAITNLAEGNYNRKFTATPYAKIGEDVYYGAPVTRSIYQVAAGLLVNDKTADGDSEVYDDAALAEGGRLYKVLNAYVNQTGIRLSVTSEGLTAYTGTGTSAYSGEQFFEVVKSETVSENVYAITIKPAGSKTTINSYWQEYIRINNNNSKIAAFTSMADNGDGTVTITFDYASYLAQ